MTSGAGSIRIAYLIEQIATGGSERQLVELLRRLDRNRFQPRVVTGTGSGFVLEDMRQLEVPIVFIRGQLGGGKLATIRAVEEVRRFRPHILHSYNFADNTWAQVSGALVRTPIVITGIRGKPTDLGPLQTVAYKALRRFQRQIVSNSQADRDSLIAEGIPANRISVVYNGIDLQRFPYPPDRESVGGSLSLSPGRPVVGMVGSFRAVKGWDVFLRAVQQVASSHPVTVLCVGDGALRPQMEDLAKELGIVDVTQFLGERPDAATIISGLDVLVSASRSEGLSNVILEAMANGVPVVATRVGGSPELVDEGETGFLVSPDDPTGMASMIMRLLDNRLLRTEMGEQARRQVETRFASERYVADTVAMYEGLLKRHRIQA